MAERPTRWQKTKTDWPGFEWKDLVPAGIGLAVAIVVLVDSRFPGSTVAEVAIVGGSAMAAGVLWALLQLVWAWLHAPMRLLTEDVVAIRACVEQLQPKSIVPARPKGNIRLKLVDLKRVAEEILKYSGQYRAMTAEAWAAEATDFVTEHIGGEAAERFLTAGPTGGTAFQRLRPRLQVLDELIEKTPHDDAD